VSDGLVIGVHCRWDYCIEKKLVNRAAAFGHHGNDVEIFVQILSWMEGNPRRYQEMMAGRVSGFMAQKDNRNLVVTTTGVAQKPGWLALQWS
jgi:hypothetical protein